jgi:N-carbamoyl-L-amino-acid hydrolase
MTTPTPSHDSLRINGGRLWDSLMQLAQIGATEKGGVCRLALTDLDKQGRDLVTGWAREAGLTVTIDKIGNGFLRRAGKNNALPPIVTGSHIDTQPTGGKFDGNYGVLAGLEVVRTLNDHNIVTEAPLEVAFWTNEEGSRFVPVMMGSGVFAGAFTLEKAYAATDTAGKSVGDELARIGYVGPEEPGAHPIGAYFETHIEQGPVLEDHDVTIGVVTGVLLAVARIAGETAPLLFTALNNQFWTSSLSEPMASLPVTIFKFAMSPYENWQKLAWAGVFLITLAVLTLNILARVLTRSKS